MYKVETKDAKIKIIGSLDGAKFEEYVAKSFDSMKDKVEMDGFRKGKVTREMFVKKHGEEILFNEAANIVIDEAIRGAITNDGVEFYSRPEVNVTKAGKDGLEFEATADAKPEVKLGDYKGLKVEKEEVEVKEEEVEAQITQLLASGNSTKTVERAAENGDIAVIDFEGFVDGEAFEGGKGEGHPLELGSNSFIPGFEEQLVGAKAGDKVEVTVCFPEEYHAENLAGKESVFKCTVHEVQVKEEAKLDDEFVAKLGVEDLKTPADLKARIKEDMLKYKEEQAKGNARVSVIDQAAENATVEVTPGMVAMELEQVKHDFEQNLQQQGLNIDMYKQFTGQDDEALEAELSKSAEKNIVTRLTLEEIAKAEKIEANEADIDAEVEKIVAQYGMEKDQVKGLLEANMDSFKKEIVTRKTVDFLIENAK